jgi:hypothetical protein
MCLKILDVAANGGHVAQMCAAIGVRSFETFYRWVDEIPEFHEAYEESKVLSQAYYENLCLQVATGQIDNASSSILAMTMYNKFAHEYKRGTNSEINIGSINTIEKLDDKKLDEQIHKLQAKLGMTTSSEEN